MGEADLIIPDDSLLRSFCDKLKLESYDTTRAH